MNRYSLEVEDFLIEYLKRINDIKNDLNMDNRLVIRGLMNITDTDSLNDEFYKYQDEYLQELLSMESVTDAKYIKSEGKIAVTSVNMTLIKADAIVNCANFTLEGCKTPLHACLDNEIHSFAGLQLRRDCKKIARSKEITKGNCYITKGYNLPCKFIFHIIVNDVRETITEEDKQVLKSCYNKALEQADNYNLKTIVFPSIEFDGEGYPVNAEAMIAYNSVKKYFEVHPESEIEKVVFNVNSSYAYDVYSKIIKNNGKILKIKK